MRLALLVIAVLGVLAAAQTLVREERARAQDTTVVQVGDLWFCGPAFGSGVCETTIGAGDTVQWQWTGVFPHTTTECAGDLDLCPEPHLWDSPVQTAGTFSFTFDTPGTYVYRCQVHSSMRGRIIVLAATATPTPTAAATVAASPSPTAEGSGSAPSPTPAPAAVPAAGSVPPADGPAGPPWWLVVAGMALVGAAGLAALRAARS